MDDKYKQLHLLVDQISARLAEAEQENIVLRAKVRALESSLRVMESAQAAAKALKEWKDLTTSILKKLYAKIDKEIERIEARSSAPQIGEK
jgi:translation initiation factor 2B subunit (eIF-2B alpha/beta/delta family)